MQALQDRLAQLTNPTGSEIWTILKESEEDLRADLLNLGEKKRIAEENGKKKLAELSAKKEELQNLKKDVQKCQEEYKKYVETVKNELKRNGIEFEVICRDFEKERELKLSAYKSEIRGLLAIEGLRIPKIAENIKRVVQILKDNRDSNIHQNLESDFEVFYSKALTQFRVELWNFLQQNRIPMVPINDTLDLTDLPEFHEKLSVFCKLSGDLNYLMNQQGESRLIASFLGQVTNICMDMLEKEKDFSWILTCALKWSNNIKEVVTSAIKIEEKEFDKELEKCIHILTSKFIKYNIEDPLIFSKLLEILRKFESDFDDLFVPFYEPEVLSKRILLEIEVFSLESTRILNSERCFDPLDACFLSSSSDSRWSSELIIFFEEWIQRINSEVKYMKNEEVQIAFYETAHILISDLCSKIHETANRLYMESSWANDVYLVMNNVWEIRVMIESLTLTWPISSMNIEKEYEKEWNRLGDMIMEYLNDIVCSMDEKIRSNYSTADKPRVIASTFNRIVKCLSNVSKKISKSSKSTLLNKLISELFIDLQKKFDFWQRKCDFEIISIIYLEIYGNLMDDEKWKKQGEESRREITQLDALMKVAANKDPSGELVRIAFRSIDEEQVAKMLAELGIKSTSDHAFQDYQILAENWDKIQHY